MIIQYKMEIEKLEEELNKVEFTSLLKDNWEVLEILPVIDNNNPILIMLMHKSSNKSLLNNVKVMNKRSKYFSLFITFMLLSQLAFTIYQNTI
jgi:hypothetical protein